MYVHMYVCMYVCMYVHTYACIHCMYVHVLRQICMYNNHGTYICTYIILLAS